MILALECCDCQTLCPIKFCLLTTRDRIVYVTVCPACNDHATLRKFVELDHNVWIEAEKSGVPVIQYQRAA